MCLSQHFGQPAREAFVEPSQQPEQSSLPLQAMLTNGMFFSFSFYFSDFYFYINVKNSASYIKSAFLDAICPKKLRNGPFLNII
jgi:hypothetical protein